MQSYDQIQGFEYWNTDAWKGFIKDYISPIHNSTSKLLKLRDFILMIVGTNGKVTLSEVERKRSDILLFLLGGIKEDGEYKDNSLARLIRLTLGVYINPKEWVTLEKEESLKAFDYVTVKSENTSFLEFLKKLNDITQRIVKLVGIESKEVLEGEIEGIVQKPEAILEVLRNIYVRCLQISANHNYYTFFTLGTKTLPFKYAVVAYPRLQANFSLLKDFLGLEKIFEPRIGEEKVREDYTIWGHLKGGLCSSLYELNNVIWENFSKKDIKNVFSCISLYLIDLEQEYVQKIQQELQRMKWSPPTYIKISHETNGKYHYTYLISGSMLTKVRESSVSWKGNPYTSETVCNVNLLRLLHDISPLLFLGSTSYQLKISGDTLEIVKER